MKINKEAVMVGSILVTSFAAFANVAVTTYPEIPAPVETVEELPVPIEDHGDHPTTLPNCEQEDSVDCYWDATRFGDGTGTSFVNISGVIYFLPKN